jgi:hypothetical protein
MLCKTGFRRIENLIEFCDELSKAIAIGFVRDQITQMLDPLL